MAEVVKVVFECRLGPREGKALSQDHTAVSTSLELGVTGE